MTCPGPLLGKSLVWSEDDFWFWRSTTRYIRHQSIVLHFGLLPQSSILLGHHLGNIHLSAKKGKRKWSYRSVSYPSIEGSRVLGEQLMATQSKAAQTQSNNNGIGIRRNIDLKPRFSAECWRPVKMIQPQDGLCKNFYQEQERVCITRNFSFERKYLRAMWEILCDERHPFIEFSLWKHALCRKEEK